MIPLRPAGRTGIDIPVLGFGVSGPHASPLTSRRLTHRLIRQALEAGVGLFDTAPLYGGGEAERRLGEALQGVQNRAFVVTKARAAVDGVEVPLAELPAHYIRSVEESLKRMRLERLGAFLLYGPAQHHLTPDVFEALQALKASGKIALFGVCGRGEELDYALDRGGFDLVMMPAGPAFGRVALTRAARARDKGMGVLGVEIISTASSMRAPRRLSDLWYLGRAAQRRAARLAAGDDVAAARSSPAKDLAWALAEACDCAVITTTRPRHLAENIRTAARAASM